MKTEISQPRRPLVAAALNNTRKAFLGVAILSAVTNLLMLTGPLYMMQIYDRVLASRSVPTLVALSLLMIGLYLLLGILEIIRARVLTQIGQWLEEQLGSTTFDTVLTLPLKMSRKDAIVQPLNDLDQVRQFMSGPGPIAICDLPWLPLYLAILFFFHAYFGWLALAGAIILIALTLYSEITLREPMRRLARLASARGEYIEAGRRNAEALHAMGMRTHYASRWEEMNGRFVDEQRQTRDKTGSFATASKIFRMTLQSIVLALGAWLSIQQLVSPGAMIAASILVSRALSPIEQVIGQWRGFVSARQARHRLQELLDKFRVTRPSMKLPPPKNNLNVSGLTVLAPGSGTPIVRDVSFELNAGQGLGIIGPSASGKSTLARALVGIWPPARGTIRLDGAEIEQWDSERLGQSIGYLPQDVELFDGTVAENIARFTSPESHEDIIEAARSSGGHELILSLPDGYDTRIGPSGAILSAGQRQRIGLARAFFGSPFLIVLDEPNANLDADGEAALTGAIRNARANGAIVVVIAHRPNALIAVDQVLVLANGAAVACGPRDEVLKKTTIKAVQERA